MSEQATQGKTGRIRRGGDVRVKVSPDIQERLERLSLGFGMPPGTLAAMALGQWIAQQERSLMMTEAMANAVGQQMGSAMADELRDQLKLFGKAEG